jgi:hypothetical protein
VSVPGNRASDHRRQAQFLEQGRQALMIQPRVRVSSAIRRSSKRVSVPGNRASDHRRQAQFLERGRQALMIQPRVRVSSAIRRLSKRVNVPGSRASGHQDRLRFLEQMIPRRVPVSSVIRPSSEPASAASPVGKTRPKQPVANRNRFDSNRSNFVSVRRINPVEDQDGSVRLKPSDHKAPPAIAAKGTRPK